MSEVKGKAGQVSDTLYIPSGRVLELFRQGESICAETEEHIHGENVIIDFNIQDCSEQVIQELIDDGYDFFID